MQIPGTYIQCIKDTNLFRLGKFIMFSLFAQYIIAK